MIKLFVPGRLCLFGEHTDWAGHYRTMNADIAPGAAIVTGIEQGIYAEVERSSIFELYSMFITFSCVYLRTIVSYSCGDDIDPLCLRYT